MFCEFGDKKTIDINSIVNNIENTPTVFLNLEVSNFNSFFSSGFIIIKLKKETI